MSRYNQNIGKQPRKRMPRRIEKDKPSPNQTHLQVEINPDEASNPLSIKINTIKKNNLFDNNGRMDS